MRLEHLLQPLLGNPWPFIIDMQDKRAVVVIDVQVGVLAVLQGVVDQVADAALERQRFARIGRQGVALLGHAAVTIG
ncbi:hypothetical protein D3C80_1979280 [compost metagenome]